VFQNLLDTLLRSIRAVVVTTLRAVLFVLFPLCDVASAVVQTGGGNVIHRSPSRSLVTVELQVETISRGSRVAPNVLHKL